MQFLEQERQSLPSYFFHLLSRQRDRVRPFWSSCFPSSTSSTSRAGCEVELSMISSSRPSSSSSSSPKRLVSPLMVKSQRRRKKKSQSKVSTKRKTVCFEKRFVVVVKLFSREASLLTCLVSRCRAPSSSFFSFPSFFSLSLPPAFPLLFFFSFRKSGNVWEIFPFDFEKSMRSLFPFFFLSFSVHSSFSSFARKRDSIWRFLHGLGRNTKRHASGFRG